MLMGEELQSGSSSSLKTKKSNNFSETTKYVRYTKPNGAINYNPAGAMAAASASNSTIFGVLDR